MQDERERDSNSQVHVHSEQQQQKKQRVIEKMKKKKKKKKDQQAWCSISFESWKCHNAHAALARQMFRQVQRGCSIWAGKEDRKGPSDD
jgi:hypothetical protein